MKKLFFSLMTLLLAFTGVVRAQELTVHDGTTTNSYVPVYGFYADAYLKSEMVYPADELSEMTGSDINSMTFYASQSSVSWGSANFQVSLTEVGSASISAFAGPGTVVYEGALSIVDNQMYVEFTEPYSYGGGNLLVCVYNTATGSYVSSSWYGETVNGASVQGYSYSSLDGVSPTQRNFLPKTTFEYSGGGPITCPKPTGLTVTLTPGDGSQATLAWTENGMATQWQICIDDDETQLILTQTNPATITGFVPEMTYTAKVRAYCDANDQSAWSNTVTFQPSDKIRIGSGTATNSYLPTYTYYNYSLTQQIYTADEILSGAGAILSVDFFASAERTRTLDVYMVNTPKMAFESTTDWITVTSDDLVYSGEVIFAANTWTPIVLDNPFAYDGESNVAIIVDDNTGSYVSSASFYAFNAENQAIRIYSDGTNYNPLAPSSYTGALMSQKNQIRLDVVTGDIVFHTITVNCNPANAGVLTGGGNALEGRIRTLTATPNYGYEFINWTKDGQVVSTEPTYSFTVTEDATFTANFYEIPRHIVRVRANPMDGGYVTGGGTYLENDTITITATPADGFAFMGWEDSNHTIVADTVNYTFGVTADVTYTALFQVEEIWLTMLQNNDTVYYIDLGERPTGAWMRPVTATLANNGAPATITSFASEEPYFGIDLGDLSVPFTIEEGQNVEFGVTWSQEPIQGLGTFLESNLTIDYENGDYNESQSWLLMGYLYNPEPGDVWETAFEVNSFPYTSTFEPYMGFEEYGMHNNYFMPRPSIPDGFDAVYKLTFTEDTYLNVSISNPDSGDEVIYNKLAVYQEDFQGVGGPDVHNNYTGPSSYVAPATRDLIEIGDGGTATNQYLPGYNFYKYSLTQQIYTAEEIGMPGTIYSIAFKNTGAEKTRTYSVYMMNVEKETFANGSDWEPMSDNDLVFTGELTFTVGEWTTITLDTPFEYDGTSNLLVGVADNTGSYTSSPHMTCLVYDASSQAIRAYRDSEAYDVAAPGVTGTVLNVKNQIQLDLTPGAIDANIYNMVMIPGTYYLVASTTATNGSLSPTVVIETDELTCPDPALVVSPANGAAGFPDVGTTLQWNFNEPTTQYCLLFGTDPENLETLVDWTRDLQTQYTITDTLNYQTTYYWKVGVRNDGCPDGMFNETWNFTTSMSAPTELTAEPGTEILQGETLHLSWTAPAEHRDAPVLYYNVYQRNASYTYDSIANTTETTFNIAGLENTGSSYTSYTYAVKAVYQEGISGLSNAITVNVYSAGMVNGHVYEQDGTTPIADATVTFAGTARDYVFTTASNGSYSAQLPAKTFSDSYVYATVEGYQETHRGSALTVYADSTLVNIDFIMLEDYYPPVDVVAVHYPDAYDFASAQAQVSWSAPVGDMPDEGTAEVSPAYTQGDRSNLDGGIRSSLYYRVYLTKWDNYNYNEFNTVRIADNVTDLSVIDENFSTFDTLDAGVYKYGVSCVYGGNHNRDEESYIEGFDNGMPSGWNTIDADGDGYGWMLGSACGGIYLAEGGSLADNGHDGSEDLMTSGSYSNVFGALTPDNYLITPQMTFGNTFTFWAQAQDASYAAEHFGVAVSTTNNTSASAFTTIQEWTIGSRNANPRPTQIRGGNREATAWVQYSVDLSAYAGQEGYLAIRHFNCTDQFLLNIDDVLVWGEPPAPYFLPTESVITWSNAIDKGYYLYDGVTVNVTLSNGESPEGTTVGMMQEEAQYEVNPLNETLMVTLGASGSYTWDVFRKGTYLVYAYKDGYIESDTVMVINSDTLISLTLNERLATASDLYVSRTGWATWNVPTIDTVTSRSLMASKVSLTELDGDTIFTITTSDNFVQVPVINLTELEIYRFNVSLVYSGGTSEPVSVPWVYEPCYNFAAANNRVGLVGPEGATLTWEYPELTAPTRTQATELWNEVTSFDAAEGAQYGVASDGEYIYTCNWGWSDATYNFFKYDMEGNMIEGFNVPGCGYIRDLTYDGRYFYGGASSTTLYCIDLANKRLVRTISTSVTIRHCSYDPEYDGFWVGNWNTLYLINRSGTIQFTGVAPSSCSGSGYYVDDNGNSHLYLLCQPEQNALVYDYDIATNIINPTPVFDLEAGLNEYGGTSGGAFIGEYNGYTAFFGDLQVTPNRIGIYGLRANEINPIQPTSILGTLVFRDGEMLGLVTEPTFADTLGTIETQYDLRVVYDGERNCPLYNEQYTMSCPETVQMAFERYEITVVKNIDEAGSVEGAGEYDYTSTATLTALPDEAYNFVGWLNEDGETVSTEATYSFTVTGPESFVAFFEMKSFEITVTAEPEEGGTVTGEGTYNYGDYVTLTATANTGYVFSQWMLDGEMVGEYYEPEYSFVATGGGDYVAVFELIEFYPWFEIVPEDGGTAELISPDEFAVHYGDEVTLVATPNEGYEFVNWTTESLPIGDTTEMVFVSDEASYTFTMNNELEWYSEYIENNEVLFVATFQLQSYDITVSADPEEGGVVTGAGTYDYGTQVELTAVANEGYEFVNWTLDGDSTYFAEDSYMTVEVTGAAHYVAHFQLQTFEVEAFANPDDGGEVEGAGTYAYGDTVVLTATPAEGYTFVNWMMYNQMQVSVSPIYSFIMTEETAGAYYAVFTMNDYVVTAVANPEEGGYVEGFGPYNHGETCTLIATAAEGYTFVNWTKNGEFFSADETVSFVVTESANYVASFSINFYSVTVVAEPEEGGVVEGTGSYAYGSEVTLTATANTGYYFDYWMENGEEIEDYYADTLTFTVTDAVEYTAVFHQIEYYPWFTIVPEDGGNAELISPNEFAVYYGDEVTIVATANEGYDFVNWTTWANEEEGEEMVISTDASYTFTMSNDNFAAMYPWGGEIEFIAHFQLQSFEITAEADPAAGGRVTGAGTYGYGSTANLTAIPNNGYQFLYWTLEGDPTFMEEDDQLEVEVTSAAHYVAHFEQINYEVEVYAMPEEGGVVTGAGTYHYGDEVTLVATANEGYIFVNWVKNQVQVSVDATYTFSMTDADEGVYIAVFSQNDYLVTAVANPVEGGIVTGTGAYNHGEEATLTATPNEGYNFLNWMLVGGEVVSTEPTYTFVVTASVDYVANFELSEVTQTTELAQGWNWWSSYVDLVDFDGFGVLTDALGNVGVMIKSQNDGFASYQEGFGWYGSLDQIDNDNSYQLKVSEDFTLDFVGNGFVDPANHPITLNNGWTWVGYPVPVAMSLVDAMSNINPTSGDMIKSQNDGFASFQEGFGWYGSLNTLTPGMGLMYRSANTNEVTLIYPNGEAKGGLKANLRADDNRWVPNLNAYPDNMSVMAVIKVNDEELRSESYELAAFANGECRGSVRLLYVEPIDRYVAFLTVAGEDVTELYFGLYNAETGEELVGSDESVNFSVNAVLGSFTEPYVVSFRGTTGLNEMGKTVNVYPNPVAGGQMLNVAMSVEGAVVRVEVVNALGAVVSVENATELPASVKAPETPGVYMLRITTESNETFYRKFVVR